MKSDLFPTELSELVAPGHYSLAARIELPLNGKEVRIPLRLSPTSHIELKRSSSHHDARMSQDLFLELVRRVIEQHAIIRQATGEKLQLIASVQGALGFNGVGKDIELARYGNPHAVRLYFDVSRLVISNEEDMLFQHPRGPIDRTCGLGSHITASYEIVTAWLKKQQGIMVS